MDTIYQMILKRPETVFSIKMLSEFSGMSGDKLSKSLNYFVKCGKIGNPRRGIYTKPNYRESEMACSIFNFSYISLEYVLQRSGVVFQYDDKITCVSYLNRNVSVDGKYYQYRRINPEFYADCEGLIKDGNAYIATAERAFLDMLYLSCGWCYFDNLRPLDRDKVNKLLKSYNSVRLTKRALNLLKME